MGSVDTVSRHNIELKALHDLQTLMYIVMTYSTLEGNQNEHVFMSHNESLT